MVMGSAEVTAYFLASSLEISSSVRPLVSGTQRKTNTSRAKLMAAWRNMTLGRPIFSEDLRVAENSPFVTLSCFSEQRSRCKSWATMQTNANPVALRALNQGTQLLAGGKKHVAQTVFHYVNQLNRSSETLLEQEVCRVL